MHLNDFTLTSETRRILLYLGLSIGCLSTVFGLILSKVKSAVKPYLKSIIFYAIIYAVVFAGITWLSVYFVPNNFTQLFMLLQLIVLVLGITNRYTLPKYMKWHDAKTFWLDLFYTFIVGSLGAFVFVLVYRAVGKPGMEWYMCSAFLVFPLPLLVLQTFKKAIDIPPKIFKLWYYPVQQQEVRFPDEKLLKNMLVISFEFKKKETDSYFTNFRAKAPVDMEIGELFYYFINDYNDRHPQDRIVFQDKNTGAPNGWLFYKKPKWYTILTKYIDTERTAFINTIRENDIIVCQRAF